MQDMNDQYITYNNLFDIDYHDLATFKGAVG